MTTFGYILLGGWALVFCFTMWSLWEEYFWDWIQSLVLSALVATFFPVIVIVGIIFLIKLRKEDNEN